MIITATSNSLDKIDILEEIDKIEKLKMKVHIISLKGTSKLFKTICEKTNGDLQICSNIENLNKKFSVIFIVRDLIS